MQTRKEFLSLFIGILFICFILWNRLFRVKLPRQLLDFSDPFLFSMVISNVLLWIFVLLITLKHLLFTENNGSFISSLLAIPVISKLITIFTGITIYFVEGPKTVYKFISNPWNIAHLLEVPFYEISFFLKELPLKYSFIFKLIHLFFHMLPKTIPPIIFIREIVLFSELNYFYKSLFLYLIPLCYNVLLWILGNLSDYNINYATAHVNLVYHIDSEFTITFRSEIPAIKDAVDIVSRYKDQELLHWFGYIYCTYRDIKWLVYRLDIEKQTFHYYENLLFSLLYLTGWIYILCNNLTIF